MSALEMFRFREPGDDDDLIEPEADEVVPLGLLLREIELDQRERALEERASVARMEQVIRARIAECIKRTMQAVRWGKGQPPSPHWELLGRLELERLHGGVERVWVEGKDGARGEWRSKYRKTCGKQGCRACGGRTR